MSSPRPRVQVKKLRPDAAVPRYMTEDAAGMDLCAALDAPVVIAPGRRAPIGTGLALAIPRGYEGQLRPRSGLAREHGITLANSPATIDADYRGHLVVVLSNLGDAPVAIEPGQRIAQLVIAPVVQAELAEVDELAPTARGEAASAPRGGDVARARQPTDERATEVYDPTRPDAGARRRVGLATPTELSAPRLPPPPTVPGVRRAPPPEPAAPTHAGGASEPSEPSEPIRVISMKAPGGEATPVPARAPRHHEARLRPLDEVRSRAATPAGGLGYLAPPRDPREARTRRWRDYAVWGSIAALLACSIAFGIWLVAS